MTRQRQQCAGRGPREDALLRLRLLQGTSRPQGPFRILRPSRLPSSPPSTDHDSRAATHCQRSTTSWVDAKKVSPACSWQVAVSADVTFRDRRQRTARLQPAHTTTFARHRFLPIRLVGAEDAEALSCSRVGILHESGEYYHSGVFFIRGQRLGVSSHLFTSLYF
ncbi:hypothetical protein IG631_09641 [Alternaria alternata]|nr:hypothetical protein IG631_09641 [Alternaria alternata]